MVSLEEEPDLRMHNSRKEKSFSHKSLKTVKRNCIRETDDNTSKEEEIKTSTTTVSLQKNIDFISCLGIVIGTTIGSGIFVSPKGVLLGSGSVGVSLIVWILGGVKAFIAALVYAELGLLLPNSGAQYYYLLTAFHPNRKEEKSFWGSLVPFIYFWQYSCINRPAVLALQGMATAQYVLQLASLGGCGSNLSVEDSVRFSRLLTLVFIMIITAVNSYSNKLSTRLINLFTVTKLLALFFIIISGLVMLSRGTNEALKTGFEGTTLEGIVVAFYSGNWAYGDWNKLNLVTRELVNPKRDLLRSLMVSCLIITSLYFLVNLSYFAVLSKADFLSSDAVAADFADKIMGKSGVVFIVVSVVFSIFGSSIGSSFTTNRVLYAAAREGHMVNVLSYIHYERMTPSTAVLFTGLIAVLLTPQSSILGLISLMGFVRSIFTFLSTVALLILRKNKKRDMEHFQVPFVFIVLNMALSIIFSIMPLVNDPKIEYIFVMAFMLLGVPVYTIFVYYKKVVPGIDKVTLILQKIFEVVPPEDDEV